MEAITVAMIVYCVFLAALVLSISTYRGAKRRRERHAYETGQPGAPQFPSSSLPASARSGESPHDTPSAKHAA